MKPLKYGSLLDSHYRSYGFPPYKWSEFRTTTWTPFEKQLKKARVALLGSSGISRRDQEPYDPFSRDDLTYREIHKHTRAEELVINDAYYDHSDADKDTIGELAEVNYGLGMGRMYKRTALQTQLAAGIAAKLKQDKVDVLFCIAT
ncbi:hypothetical protein ES703_114878 [subsurface metagenome]